VRKLVVSRPLEGAMISMQRVKRTSCIKVDGVAQLDEDMIAMHFENRRRSGGAEVKKVCKHHDFAVVQFKNRNGILYIAVVKTYTFTKKLCLE